MQKIREEQTKKLEEAAAQNKKFGGWKKMRTSSKISLVLLILVAAASILAPILAPHNPTEIFNARMAPGDGFLFGTDDKGRDILSLLTDHRLRCHRHGTCVRLHHRRACRGVAQGGI